MFISKKSSTINKIELKNTIINEIITSIEESIKIK
jgi:hypothetical protein